MEYFRKNVKLNKVEEKVKVYEGDVKEVLPKLEGEFDRILMPSPYIAENFISAVRGKIRRGGIVHYYTFAGKEEEKEILPKRVVRLFREQGIDVELEHLRQCGHYAPYVYRYVLDLRVKS